MAENTHAHRTSIDSQFSITWSIALQILSVNSKVAFFIYICLSPVNTPQHTSDLHKQTPGPAGPGVVELLDADSAVFMNGNGHAIFYII